MLLNSCRSGKQGKGKGKKSAVATVPPETSAKLDELLKEYHAALKEKYPTKDELEQETVCWYGLKMFEKDLLNYMNPYITSVIFHHRMIVRCGEVWWVVVKCSILSVTLVWTYCSEQHSM